MFLNRFSKCQNAKRTHQQLAQLKVSNPGNFVRLFSYSMNPMGIQMKRAILVLSGLLITALSWSIQPGSNVENFRLFDHKGGSHELYYYDDQKAVVFMVQGNGCPIVRNAMPRFKELRNLYTGEDVQFFLINSNFQDKRETISDEAYQFSYDIPILIDDTQIIGESLDLIRTGEVFVVDPKTWTVVYRGALDDRLTYENQKQEATEHFLKNSIDEILTGQKITVAQTEAVGCLINFPEKSSRSEHSSISYSKEIAPILKDNCVSCHRNGGIGPWAMTDYNMVKGLSLMIREVLRTKRMPPWHADPSIGHFSNDRSLTNEQTRKIVHWIEAGSPRGGGDDPIAEKDISFAKWANEPKLGPPDYVIDIPAMEIPASGIVDYQYHLVKNDLPKDTWVGTAEILPGDPSVLHHVITSFGYLETEGRRAGRLKRQGQGGLRGYAPGINADPMPADTGMFLPAGTTLQFQMHYTPVGKPIVDETKMGLWVLDKPPKHRIFSMSVLNTKIKIPAHAKNHKESVTREVHKDAMLYSMLPHAHFRGKAMEMSVIYPDGSNEVLLSVPNYDFNWQTSYELSEPKIIPAGSKLVQHNWWDNSGQNKANPDPSIEVTWGQQSFEEMLFGNYLMRYLDEDEVAALKTRDQQKITSTN